MKKVRLKCDIIFLLNTIIFNMFIVVREYAGTQSLFVITMYSNYYTQDILKNNTVII